jgi:hypothetical protein
MQPSHCGTQAAPVITSHTVVRGASMSMECTMSFNGGVICFSLRRFS